MTAPPFQAFLDSHREDVYRFLVAAVGPVDADDCFQDTFVSALRAYPRVRAGSNLRAWVLTIAHRKVVDFHRGRARRPIPVEEPPEIGSEQRQNGFDPGLWGLVRELPAKQRAAVLYRFAGDLGYPEIAQALRCSEDAARQNVSEALKKLRREWKP